MAPVNRPAKQIISYEEAYPLKQTKTIKQDRHCNFWKRTLQALKKIFLAKDSPSKIRDYTLQTISYVRAESECNSEDVESISKQLEERILSSKRTTEEKEPNSFINTPEKNSAQDFAGLLWSWKVNKAAKKAGKRTQFLQKCIWLTLETMKDVDVHILAQLLMKNRSLFPFLHKHITNYKQTVNYLQEEIVWTKHIMSKVIRALNHWFTIMPLLEEIRYYTGWLFLLNIKAFLLDADTLYHILINAERTKGQQTTVLLNNI